MRKLMITPDPKFKSWLRNNIGGTNTDYIYAEIVEAVTDVVNDLTDPDSTRAWVDTMQDLLLIQIRVDDDPEFAKRDTIRKFVNEIHKIDHLLVVVYPGSIGDAVSFPIGLSLFRIVIPVAVGRYQRQQAGSGRLLVFSLKKSLCFLFRHDLSLSARACLSFWRGFFILRNLMLIISYPAKKINRISFVLLL